MNTLKDYSEFPEDIKDTFKFLINKYGFNFKMIKSENEYYELANQYILLKFTYDRGEIRCSIVFPFNSKADQEYAVNSIVEYLYPNDEIFKTHKPIYDPKDQLISYANTLKEKLSNVLEGDFSWVKGYNIFRRYESKLINYVWNQIGIDNPIYIKFKNGDASWKADLNEYLLNHNINL